MDLLCNVYYCFVSSLVMVMYYAWPVTVSRLASPAL